MWVLSVKLASCHPSGTNSFEVSPRFLHPCTRHYTPPKYQ